MVSKLEKLSSKLKMLGQKVNIYEDYIITTQTNIDNEGYNVITLYVTKDNEDIVIASIAPIYTLMKPNTKLIITGDGKPRQLSIGIQAHKNLKSRALVSCISKIVIDLDTSSITDMSDMFSELHSLEEVEFRHINTQAVTNMQGMFAGCSALKHIDLSKFDGSSLKDISGIFNECYALENISFGSFKAPRLENMDFAFASCTSIQNIDLNSLKTSTSLKSMNSTFRSCRGLESIDISNLNLNKVETFECCFYNCVNLVKIKMPHSKNMELHSATTLEAMFQNCEKLTGVDLTPVIGTEVATTADMFKGCSKLELVILKNFTPKHLKSIKSMFQWCPLLSYLDIRNIQLLKINNFSNFIDTKVKLILITSKLFEKIKSKHKIRYNNEEFLTCTDQTTELRIGLVSIEFKGTQNKFGKQAKLLSILLFRDIEILAPVE